MGRGSGSSQGQSAGVLLFGQRPRGGRPAAPERRRQPLPADLGIDQLLELVDQLPASPADPALAGITTQRGTLIPELDFHISADRWDNRQTKQQREMRLGISAPNKAGKRQFVVMVIQTNADGSRECIHLAYGNHTHVGWLCNQAGRVIVGGPSGKRRSKFWQPRSGATRPHLSGYDLLQEFRRRWEQ